MTNSRKRYLSEKENTIFYIIGKEKQKNPKLFAFKTSSPLIQSQLLNR